MCSDGALAALSASLLAALWSLIFLREAHAARREARALLAGARSREEEARRLLRAVREAARVMGVGE